MGDSCDPDHLDLQDYEVLCFFQPIPMTSLWKPGTQYGHGDIVVYESNPYQSCRDALIVVL